MTREPATTTCAALLLLLAGCAQGHGQAPPSQAQAQQVAEHAVSEVRVGLTEWTIVTSAALVRPGRVRLVVTNTGATEHDLDVQGRAGHWETPVLDPGQRATLVVRTRPGETLALWCAEPGHRAQGMHTVLRATARP